MDKKRKTDSALPGGDPSRALEKAMGYRFGDPALLAEALTHRSWANEHPSRGRGDNERLEFLGDAVLGLAAAEYLTESLPEAAEGELTRIRSSLVDETSLAAAARRLGLGGHLLLGRGEDASGGRGKPSILSGSLEALAGAVFLDGGWEAVQAFARGLFPRPALLEDSPGDAKTRLQEICQDRFRATPGYTLVERSGPPHRPLFTAAVELGGKVLARGDGASKKAAEQAAAEAALTDLEER